MSDEGRRNFLEKLPVSHETEKKLVLYAETLKVWNKKINLVSPSTIHQLWERHFLDSAQLTEYIPENIQKQGDIGSGAGFPGLIMALLCPHKIELVESDQRKVAFMREVSRLTKSTHVTFQATRIEKAIPIKADIITARALASLTKLIDLSIPHLNEGGTCLFLKGEDVQKEIDEAEKTFSFALETFQSKTSDSGVIVRLSEIRKK